MPEVQAEEIKESTPVDSAADQCAEIIKAKETCLSEVSSLSEALHWPWLSVYHVKY